MKILRAVILGAMLMFAAPKMNPQSEPPQKIEYVVGACGGRNFTVLHGTLEDTKLSFDSYMPEPGSVLDFDTPMVFDVKKSETKKKDEFNLDGVLVDKDPVEIHGVLRNNRIAALTVYNGNLSVVMYGSVAKRDDMVKQADEDFKFCQALRAVDMNTIPDVLNDFMDHGSVKADSQQQ